MSDEQFRIECENKIVDLIESVEELKGQVDNNFEMILSQNSEQFDTIEVLRKYFKYRTIWSEEIMKRMDTLRFEPIDTWSMISLHKISKELLEMLDFLKKNPNNKNCIHNDRCTTYLVVQNQCKECLSFKPKKGAKKEYIASLNDPKAFEAVNLGVLKRSRTDSRGENADKVVGVGGATPTRNVEREIPILPVEGDDSKPSEPKDCFECGFFGKNGEHLKSGKAHFPSLCEKNLLFFNCKGKQGEVIKNG